MILQDNHIILKFDQYFCIFCLETYFTIINFNDHNHLRRFNQIHLGIFIFQAFFNSGAMASVLDSFCIYHVTAPGQESGAKNLPDDFVYPNMDELSEQV